MENLKGVLSTLVEPSRNEQVTVGTSASTISDNRNSLNPRKVIVVRNTSTGGQTITINLGNSPAVAGFGVVLKTDESFTDTTEAEYTCFQGMITAISSAAGGLLSIFER